MYGVVLVLAFWIGLAPPEALAAHGDTHTPVGTVITFDSATVKFTWLLTSTNTLFKDSRVLNTPGVDYDTVQLLSAVDVTANIETAYIGPNETAVFVKHVRNLGNGADTFRLRADSAANLVTGVFLDADGDSVYDASDPPRDSIVLLSISDTNALYETVVLVVAQAPPTAFDGQVDTVQFSATSTDILPHAETVSLVLTVDSQPPTVPAQQSPASDHDTTQTVLTFTWSASTDTRSGLARYRFQMDTAGSFTAPAVDSTTGETTYTVPAALTANLYYWRVRAIDTVGNVTNNTDSFHVRVDTGEKITLVSPSSDHETSATTVRFAWSTEDNAETYTWQFSKSAAFAAISDSAVDTSATTIVKNLTDQDTYYWRVIGRDRVGNYDTTAGRFILLDTTVFAVSLAAPADGHETTAAVFLVAWSAVGDSVGIDSYALELAKNTGFTNMVFTDTVDAGPSASGGSDTVTGLYNDTYYWRVRAIDDLGNQGTYSSTRGFVTDTHVAQVALVSPANNTSTPDTTPTLSWSAVGDSVGIDSYVVEVSGHPAFAYTNFSDTIDGALTSDTTGILADSTYYWRVRGIDHLGNTGANSDSFVLRIDTGVVVILVSPSAGHETNVGTIVFTWSGDAADTFTWQISRSSVFATISDSVVDTTSLSLLRTLPAQDSFYWRVIVRDASGNEDTAAGRIIVLDSTAAPVTLSYPADRHETTAIGILVGWTATADSVGLDSYAVEVSTNSAFTNMAFTDTLDAISSAAGGSDTLTGLYNDTYYWRVRAIDDLGNQGAFTASRGFVTDTLVNQVTLSFPADRHETTAINLVAGWSAVADSVGVDSYAVEVSTNTAFTNLVFTDTLDMLLTTDTITGLYNDTYYWRVRAIDNLGNVGPASTQRTFVLDTAVDRVTLAGPPKGTTSSNPNVALTWNELADSVGIDSYAVELSSSPVFAAFNFADTVAGSRTSDTTTSLVSSTYYWRVRAIDRLGNIGQSSDSFYFLIDTSLTVTLSAPPDGHETTAITVLFVWSGNLTDTYTWQLSRSAAFATLADSVTDTGAESLLRTMPGEDTFYWRVIGRDTTGSMDTQMRGLVVDTSVNQVGLASPSDGHETTSSRVVVSWTAVSDSVGIDSYAVEVSRTPAFTALAYADTLDGAVTSDTPVLADNDSYHVRVRAIDHLGNNGTYSAARGFVTDTRVSQVVLASPSDGHETTSSRVVVSWTAVSDSVGIDSYAVEVSRTPAFTALAYADTLDGAATSDTPVLADNDSYHVRVRAIDHLGNAGTYSAARGFMTDTRVGQVVLAFPSDGHETTSSRVVVGWTAVSDSVGIDSYAIEVSRTPAFTALAYADTLDGAVTSDTPALADNDSYHVRVRAIDHLGNAGTYSAARGFVMDTRVGRVVLDTPADKTVTPDSTPTLAWNAVSDSVGIDSYVLEVSASPTFSAMAFVDTVDGSRTSDTTAILADSTYYWRVRAIDELGNVGQNSDSFQIEIDTERVTVTLIAPPNGFQTISETVSFQWSSNRADTFTWQLSRSAAFDSVLVAFADTSVETFVRIISGEDTFYWRVIARDTTGTFDTAASGFVIDRTPPAPVTAVAPADGHETRQAPVTVTWSAVTVVDTVGIDSYVVEVSRSAAFTTTVRVDTVDAAVTADTLFGLENDTYYWRVHAVDHLGNIGVSANTLRFTTDTQVDTVTLDTPLNGATLTNPSPTLNWRAMADSVGIANYALEVSGDSAFTSTVFADTVAGTGTSGAVGVALAADSYFWRVRAIDRVGNIGLNSASFEFRVDTGVSVTLVSPPSGHETTATSITFVWSTADDAETYTWQLSRSAAFTAISDSVVDTSATSVTKSLTAEDTYYWRVTGSDRIGNFDTRTGGFVIDTHAGQVSLASPADGHETTNAALSLQLTALSDSVGIDSYVFEVSKSAVFAATIFSDTVDGALTSDTATGLYNDTYYWRARAIDRLGNAGQVSASRGFLVDTAVETVALIAPSAGHETSNAKVVVTWAAVTADSVGIDSYALEVSRAAAFTSLVFADTVDAALTSDTITGLDNDTFYWRVRAVDFLGNAGLNSAARGFLIDTAAGQITLSAPADGSATRDTTPTFSWSINSDSVGIDSFVLEVSANSTFTNLKFVDTVDGAVTSDTALPFLAEDTYYWRVIAVDNLGNTAAPASAFRFIVDTTVPSRFNLESPVDGHDTTNLRPQFTWSAAQDSGSGIFGYRLELSRDTTFAVLAQTFDTVTGSLAAALTSTDLASDTYFWRVIAIDVAGNTTASDSIFQISIVPTIASIEWSQTEYKGLTVLAQVRLIDPLANVSVFLKDFAEVTILSDADPVGFSLMFEETEINSGVFTATVGFTGGNSDVSAKKIKVNPGSGVTAKRVQTDGKTVTASARWLPELGVAPTDVTKTRSWPNPANPTLGQPIIFQNLPADPTMTIEIYTLDMKKVRTLYNGNGITASSFGNAAQWDGRNDAGQFVASGVYLYLVRSQFGTVVRRITLIK